LKDVPTSSRMTTSDSGFDFPVLYFLCAPSRPLRLKFSIMRQSAAGESYRHGRPASKSCLPTEECPTSENKRPGALRRPVLRPASYRTLVGGVLEQLGLVHQVDMLALEAVPLFGVLVV